MQSLTSGWRGGRRHRRSGVLIAALAVGAMSCGSDGPRTDPPDGSAPVGSLRVAWTIVSAEDGAPLSCAEVGIEEVDLRIGREPVRVPCGDGERLFSDLVAQTYPVRVELKFGTVTIADGVANADVVPEMETRVEVPIEVTPRNLNRGSIALRWRIDAMPAAARCGQLEASTIRIEAINLSASEVMTEAPCANGSAMLTEIEPGRYTLQLTLIGNDGSRVTRNISEPFSVRANEVSQPGVVPLVTMLQEPGRIVGLYTVSGTTAAVGCMGLEGAIVKIKVRTDSSSGGTQPEVTETSSCADGRIVATGLNTDLYSVEIGLDDFIGVRLATMTVRDVMLQRGETATVTVDLDVDL